MADADEPKPAILGRTENHVMVTEQTKRCRYHAGIERGDIGADQHHRAGRASPKRALHADAEIATTLADGLDPSAPVPDAMASRVRRHGDPQAPAAVCRQTAKQQRDHQTFETNRRNIADLTREPAFADAKTRRSYKQNKMALHQP